LVDHRARATICISWVVPFRRRPPSSVTGTRSATIVVEGVVGTRGARGRFRVRLGEKGYSSDGGVIVDGRIGPNTVAAFNEAVANGTIKPA